MEIKSRIVKTENVKWKGLEWLQGDLKKIPRDSFERLKNSLVENNFINPFNVWDSGDTLWILDGHHRKKALDELEKEGVSIPEELPANFINCKDINEAKQLVLVYSSIYANIQNETLQKFLKGFEYDPKALLTQIELPQVDMQKFIDKYISPEVYNNTNCQYPIVPKFGEKYGYVLIFCTNEIDLASLKTRLKVDKKKSYKGDAVGSAVAITFQEFDEIWTKSKS